MTEWRRRNPKRSTTEMGQENQRSCSRALQRQASFIANRGWKSSNSSPLSVGGELFPLTSPFIEQALTLKFRLRSISFISARSDDECNGDLSPVDRGRAY